MSTNDSELNSLATQTWAFWNGSLANAPFSLELKIDILFKIIDEQCMRRARSSFDFLGNHNFSPPAHKMDGDIHVLDPRMGTGLCFRSTSY